MHASAAASMISPFSTISSSRDGGTFSMEMMP